MKELNGIPVIGFGTSGLGDRALASIEAALDVGYRHVDTAQTYGTEAVIGRALNQSGLKRDEVFITTKVSDANLAADLFMSSVKASLERLGLDQVDLLLIHWPSHRDAVPMTDYMASLVEAKHRGLTRLVGVSNFTTALIDKATALLGEGVIATNQVELHPRLQNRKLRRHAAGKGISVTAYMPLGRGRLLADPQIGRIAERNGVGPAVLILAWLVQSGMIVVPASTSRNHMAANLAAAELKLSAADMAAMDALDRGERFINPAKAPEWDKD
jgi:2,5-diketo-D-gluconate reductase B